MISLELKKLLRDRQWAFLILIFAGGFLYDLTCYNELSETTGIGLFSVMNHRQLVASISAFPCFLFLYLLYRIAHQQERYAAWKTELAFRMDQRKHVGASMVAIALLQLPVAAVGCMIYYFYMQSFDMMLLRFLLTLQFGYFTCYFYYTFLVKSGILSEGMNVSVVNPMRSLTPIFFLFCIMNMGDWFDVLSVALMPVFVAMVVMLSMLLVRCNYWMRVKLHRELLLHKLFSGIENPRTEAIKQQNKKQFDAFLQVLFRIVPFRSSAYWRFVAVFEVSIKQKGYPLLVVLVSLILYVISSAIFFIILALLFLLYFIVFYQKQKANFQKVSIRRHQK